MRPVRVVKRKSPPSYLNHITVCCGLPLGFTVESVAASGVMDAGARRARRPPQGGGQRVVVVDERILVDEHGARAEPEGNGALLDAGDIPREADLDGDPRIELLVCGEREGADQPDLL